MINNNNYYCHNEPLVHFCKVHQLWSKLCISTSQTAFKKSSGRHSERVVHKTTVKYARERIRCRRFTDSNRGFSKSTVCGNYKPVTEKRMKYSTAPSAVVVPVAVAIIVVVAMAVAVAVVLVLVAAVVGAMVAAVFTVVVTVLVAVIVAVGNVNGNLVVAIVVAVVPDVLAAGIALNVFVGFYRAFPDVDAGTLDPADNVSRSYWCCR